MCVSVSVSSRQMDCYLSIHFALEPRLGRASSRNSGCGHPATEGQPEIPARSGPETAMEPPAATVAGSVGLSLAGRPLARNRRSFQPTRQWSWDARQPALAGGARDGTGVNSPANDNETGKIERTAALSLPPVGRSVGRSVGWSVGRAIGWSVG